ncbi:MAG: hypothetical protein GX131_09200 [candidate division WS1 bacterium]|nr:hypothetical protein [candidate division WS1 bacterium]
MAQYEYRVLHMPTTSVSVMNERLNNDARDGWEPVMMSGNEFINVLIRRPVEAEERQD